MIIVALLLYPGLGLALSECKQWRSFQPLTATISISNLLHRRSCQRSELRAHGLMRQKSVFPTTRVASQAKVCRLHCSGAYLAHTARLPFTTKRRLWSGRNWEGRRRTGKESGEGQGGRDEGERGKGFGAVGFDKSFLNSVRLSLVKMRTSKGCQTQFAQDLSRI